MERTMSVEEKIKRAEEIYARRHEKDTKETKILNFNNSGGTKDIKLFKKLILQIVACLLIYLIVYTVQNNNYIFSEDFINKANDILSYDTNFGQMYNDAKNAIINFFNGNSQNAVENNENNNDDQENLDNNENSDDSQENVTNSEDSNDNQENVTNNESNSEEGSIGGSNENTVQQELSEEDQKILTIKNTTTFIKPVSGTITSKYGQREPTTSTVPKNHTGTDIAANLGTKIIAATDGEVVLASSEGDYGNHLKIQIGEVSIIYAHCNSLYVKQGDKVVQGQEIAEVGSTGNSTGPHLHFEIRLNEQTIDPQKILEL